MIDFGFCNEGGGVERGFRVTGFFIKRGPFSGFSNLMFRTFSGLPGYERYPDPRFIPSDYRVPFSSDFIIRVTDYQRCPVVGNIITFIPSFGFSHFKEVFP